MKDLLQPRFIVVADYPESYFDIGTIIELNMIDGYVFWDNNKGFRIFPSLFPAIFRPLHWSEFLSEKDFPKYVKHIISNDFFKVADLENYPDFIRVQNSYAQKRSVKPINLLPATETEYNNFINLKK